MTIKSAFWAVGLPHLFLETQLTELGFDPPSF